MSSVANKLFWKHGKAVTFDCESTFGMFIENGFLNFLVDLRITHSPLVVLWTGPTNSGTA